MWGRYASKGSGPEGGGDGSAPVEGLPPSEFEILSRRLEAALDAIGEGIVIAARDGETTYRNAAAGRLLPSGPGDALARQAVSDALSDALEGLAPDRRLDLLSPSRRTLSVRAFPIVGEAGVDGAIAVIEDISERLRLEAIRRDFVANVSHELKTPTGALTLLAETIEDEEDVTVVRRLVQLMGAEADRLSRIIDDLLDLSRIEANETPKKQLVPLETVITEVVGSLQALADRLEVRLEVDPLPEGIAIPGDKRDLVAALVNLVDNGIKYSEPGGEIRISAVEVPLGVQITIADRGVGIPARDLERVFERFYRVDRARSRATGGTGLGLSIVRHVVANHGGTVQVRSVEGEGSTFVLELPAVSLGPSTDTTQQGEPDNG